MNDACNFISSLQNHGIFYSVGDTNVYDLQNWLHSCNGLFNHNGWSLMLMVTISWIWVSDLVSDNDRGINAPLVTKIDAKRWTQWHVTKAAHQCAYIHQVWLEKMSIWLFLQKVITIITAILFFCGSFLLGEVSFQWPVSMPFPVFPRRPAVSLATPVFW